MWIFVILIMLIPMESSPTWSRTILGFSLIKWVGLSAVLVAISENIRSQRSPMLTRTLQGKFFILFSLMVFLQWFRANGGGIQPFLVYMSFFIFFFVTLSVVNTPSRVKIVIWAVVICMLIASQYGIRQYRIVSQYYPGYRAAGSFKDINYFALSIVIALPFAYYLYKIVKQFYLKIFLASAMLIYCAALMFTLSRGAVVGVAALLLASQAVSKKKMKALIVLSIIVVLGFYFAPDSLKKRFEETKMAGEEGAIGAEASTTHRWHLFLAGVNMIKAHPISGVGIGNFKPLSVQYEPRLGQTFIAHNTYLSIAAEMGLPALFFFLGIIFYTYRTLWRLRRTLADDPEWALLPNVLIVSLFGFVVTALFLTAENTKLFWLLVFFTIALDRIVKEQKQREYQEAIDVEARSLDEADDLDRSAKGSANAGTMMADTKALPSGSQGGYSGGQG